MAKAERRGNVINLDACRPGFEMKQRPFGRYCPCSYVCLDWERKMVECRDCGKVFEPFEWLNLIAMREINMVWKEKEIKQRMKETSKRLDDLKRQERNARARLNRLPKVKEGE